MLPLPLMMLIPLELMPTRATLLAMMRISTMSPHFPDNSSAARMNSKLQRIKMGTVGGIHKSLLRNFSA
uniref:Uncharacterized protein n=1 Tax=Phlebotomus papatasi TaxID=29031 RepID=A0A1B0DQH2_PHLPP